MVSDVFKVGRLLERLVLPVQVLQPPVELRVVVSDEPSIALEVGVVDRVEADEGREESDVGLGEDTPDEVVLALQKSLESVERLEQRVDRLLVRGLGCREAGLVLLGEMGQRGGIRDGDSGEASLRERGELTTPLLTVSYTHSFNSSISFLSASGYRSS